MKGNVSIEVAIRGLNRAFDAAISLRNQIEVQRKAFEAEIESLKQRNADLSVILGESRRSKDDLVTKAISLEVELREANDAVEDLREDISVLRWSLDMAESVSESDEKEIFELEAEAEGLRNNIAGVERENSTLKLELERVLDLERISRNEAETFKHELRDKVFALEAANGRLRKILDNPAEIVTGALGSALLVFGRWTTRYPEEGKKIPLREIRDAINNAANEALMEATWPRG